MGLCVIFLNINLCKKSDFLEASLIKVLERLNILDNFSSLSIFTFESVSNITRIFKIKEQNNRNVSNEQESNSKSSITFINAQRLKNLRICVNSRVYDASEEKTVYVVNLF